MKTKTYYIYEVPGVKIGCTTQTKKRISEDQGFENWIILEEHTDIMIASQRERELQKEKGYKVDRIPYYEVVRRRYKWTDKERENAYKTDGAKRGGITQGNKSRDEKTGLFDPEKRKEYQLLGAKAGGKRAFELGVGIFSISKEDLKLAASRGGITQGNKSRDEKTGIFDPKKRKEYQLLGAKAGTKVVNARIILCPDGHISTPASYKNYCKHRGLDPNLAKKITN